MLGSVSFGTWNIASGSVKETVASALNVGFRSIDTASAYANERDVGSAIRQSGIVRDDLFISGKLWVARRGHDAAIKACKKSLKHMGLDYFDQYLIHWPASPNRSQNAAALNAETWGALEELVSEGLVVRIGVCNFSEDELGVLLGSASIVPCVNQIEMHPGHYPKDCVSYCRLKGVGIEAWSPLGHGVVLGHPLIQQIASGRGCSASQVCLKWCMERGAMPVVGASSVTHMLEALEADEIELSKGNLGAIDGMEEYGFSGMRSEADVL